MKLAIVWASIGVAGCALIGASCHSKPGNGLVSKGSGLYIASSADIQPDGDPGPQRAIYGGTAIPVDVKTKHTDGDFEIDLISDGVSLETEKYRTTATEFDLVNAAGEDYTPPIPLLRFPMNIGDVWSWSGSMLTGPTRHKSEATISTSNSTVDMGMPTDALMVEVDLRMASGASAPATRRLAFWFVKGKGVVKREFGASTSREPAAAQ